MNEKRFVANPRDERRQILENDHVALWFYPELRIVHHQMVTAPTSEEFRQLLTKGADTLERYGAIKWLSDDRGNKLLHPQDEEWADNQWLPRVLAAGFKFWAIVLPDVAIGKLNMQRIAAQHARRGIVSSIQADPQAAFDWLKTQ